MKRDHIGLTAITLVSMLVAAFGIYVGLEQAPGSEKVILESVERPLPERLTQ